MDRIKLKGIYNRDVNIHDVIEDVELVCIRTADITEDMINSAKISPELWQVVLKNCQGTGLPSLTCWYDNGVLRLGIRRGQR